MKIVIHPKSYSWLGRDLSQESRALSMCFLLLDCWDYYLVISCKEIYWDMIFTFGMQTWHVLVIHFIHNGLVYTVMILLKNERNDAIYNPNSYSTLTCTPFFANREHCAQYPYKQFNFFLKWSLKENIVKYIGFQ